MKISFGAGRGLQPRHKYFIQFPTINRSLRPDRFLEVIILNGNQIRENYL